MPSRFRCLNYFPIFHLLLNNVERYIFGITHYIFGTTSVWMCGCGMGCIECLIHWVIWKYMITLCIINRLRIRMNWRSISRSRLCDIIYNAFDILWVKTCMFYCNPLLVSLKKLSCLSKDQLFSKGSHGLIHAKIFCHYELEFFGQFFITSICQHFFLMLP